MRLLLPLLAFILFTACSMHDTDGPSSKTPVTKDLAVMYTYDKDLDKAFEDFTRKDLAEIGYYLNDPHFRVNDAYEMMLGKTWLDNLGFNSIMHEETVRPILNKEPRLAGFSPFNLLLYRKKSDMQTVIAHLTPEAILEILEIDDPEIRKVYIESFKPLDALLEKKFGGTKSYIPMKGLPDDTMMNFEIAFDEPEDIDDFLDEFQEEFETAFQTKGYIIAGFYNIKESFNSELDVMPGYTSFWSYALCHIPFSYTIFDQPKGIPEAGVFAPCSMYVYVKKGENKLVIGMPTLSVWAKAFDMRDPEKLKKIHELDTDIPAIIHSLGGVDTPNGNPLHR